MRLVCQEWSAEATSAGDRWRLRLIGGLPGISGMPTRRLLEFSQPAQRGHDVEAVTVAENARHRHRPGELLEVLGGRFVRHLVDDDEGV